MKKENRKGINSCFVYEDQLSIEVRIDKTNLINIKRDITV